MEADEQDGVPIVQGCDALHAHALSAIIRARKPELGCCDAGEQEACCEPDAKAERCGPTDGEAVGPRWLTPGVRGIGAASLLADVVPTAIYGRAYGFERAMDNLGAIGGPLVALALVGLIGVRGAILLSVIPGLLAALFQPGRSHTAAAQLALHRLQRLCNARQHPAGQLGDRIGMPRILALGAAAFLLAAFLYAAGWMTVALTSLTLTPLGRQTRS